MRDIFAEEAAYEGGMAYNVQKLVEVLEILAKNGQELTKLRITKLLYLIDRYHIRKYGTPVLKDKYYRLKFGPVPSLSLNYIDNFFSPICIVSKKRFKEPFDEYFERGKDRKGYLKLKLKKEKKDIDCLSDSELEAINQVLGKYGSITTGQLVNICHNGKVCSETPENSVISYELFLEGLPEQKKELIKGLLDIEEENTLVLAELSR